MKRKLILGILCILQQCTFLAFAQQEQVKGTVSDTNGEPLIGVSIVEKGTSNASMTDSDGEFMISVSPNAILRISYIGFITQEVPVNKRNLYIILEEESSILEEVVVVGYGTQKKVNLSGAVSTISSEKLENRPVMNFSSALDGLTTGVSIRQGTGNPGAEGVTINMRGITSINGSSPLVLVDGTPADMSVLNPEDIESVSFLKDAAAAAIYGSRAGSGVILVTTKKGKKAKPRVTFSALFAQSSPITSLEFMSDTPTWMDLHNVARRNASPTSGNDYPQSSIDEWRAANSNPNGMYTNPVNGNQIPNWLAYPNTDWADAMLQPSFYSKYNAQVDGGGDNSTYMLSLGYQNNPGTLDNTSMERYSIRANIETKISDFITFGTQTWGTKEFKDPGDVSMSRLLQSFPGITPIYQGKLGTTEDPNVRDIPNVFKDVLLTGGSREFTRINTTWYLTTELPIKGLITDLRFNYNEYTAHTETYTKNVPTYRFRDSLTEYASGAGALDQAVSSRAYNGSKAYTANVLLKYNNTFGKHDISGLLGYEQFWTETTGFNAVRKGLLDWSVTDITSATNMDAIGGTPKTGQAMLSYFGRIGYVYDSKYILEANFRSDSSSRFAPGYRNGFFPSGSLAWRISEENFYRPLKPYMDYFKLKASYGSLGNVVSGNYAWQGLYSKVNTILNEQVAEALIQTTQSNLRLSWEKVYTLNFGFEAKFLNQRLGAEFDVYQRKTKNMLGNIPNYLTLGNGISPQRANMYGMRNDGVELTLNWNDRIKDFKYGISFNVTYNENELTDYNGSLIWEYDENTIDAWGNNGVWRFTNLAKASTGGDVRRAEGHMVDEWYLHKPYSGNGSYYNNDGSINPKGGPKDGMIRTKADLQWVEDMMKAGYSFNSNVIGPEAANIWYGQMLMSDENGDGIYGNSDDKVFTGKSTLPKWLFGLNMSAEWKGIDFSMNWSARLGSYHYINERGANSSILANVMDQLPADALNMYYSYDAVAAYDDYMGRGTAYDPANDPNANIRGKFPRLLASSSIMTSNTFYLYNTSYLKLRSLQIGYTLPKKWLKSLGIERMRIYAAGENLLTIKSKDYPAVDPELGSQLMVYPVARMMSGGVIISF